MQKFLADIKRYTCRLRSGKCGLSALDFGLDDEALLQHDDRLLPHWKKFAAALQVYQYEDGIPELSFNNVQLSSKVIDLLAPALNGKPFLDFVLDNNDFEEDRGIEFAVECMQSNLQMKAFHLTNNQIGSVENVHSVLDAVINHPTIDNVRLENCLVDGDLDSYEVARLLVASDKKWDLLDFERNNISTGRDTTIPDYITSNPPLVYLFLEDNKLNDEDAILISHALKQNTNLKDLRLNRNNFTIIGQDAVSKALYDPTSQNTVYDCNHTCQIQLDGIDRGLPLFCNNTGPSNPKFKRSMNWQQ